jgi:HK97 family phage prohead protease
MNKYEIDFEVRAQDEEFRTFSGIAVPYDKTIKIAGISERFESGAIEDVSETKLFWNHDTPIGKITEGRDTDEGFVIEAVISRTQQGDDAYQLLKDGVINKLSVGFVPVKDRKDDGVVVREKVKLREVSLVPFPAYDEANVTAVREEEPNTRKEKSEMNEENTQEITEVRGLVEDLTREVASIKEAAPTVEHRASWETYGDFVKAVVRGDEDALEQTTRAYAGAVVSPEGPDSIGRDAWANEALLLVDHGRPSLNAFRKSGLPEAGLNIDWPSVSANTIDADVQAAQGDTLVFGKLSLETKTSPVHTVGGWTSVSRQVIERSSVAYVDAAFRSMAIQYGKKTNELFIENLKAGTYTAVAMTADAEAVSEGVADAAIALYGAAGVRPQFILAGTGAYKDLATLYAADGRPVVGGNAPVNNIGDNNIPTLSGSVLGLPIIVDPALEATDCYIANREAITTWENAGPTRLSDSDITNLTSDFSVYGYIAFGTIYPEMVVQVTGLGA